MAKPRGETAARAQLWSGALWASTVPKRRGERQPHSNPRGSKSCSKSGHTRLPVQYKSRGYKHSKGTGNCFGVSAL